MTSQNVSDDLLRRAVYCVFAAALLGCEGPTTPSGPPPTWAQIDAGTGATCGVTSAGRGYCWGESWAAGHTSTVDTVIPLPRQVPGNHQWRAIEVGRSIACGSTTEGQTLCWGPSFFADTLPTLLKGDPGLVQFSVGDTHACGLTVNGTAYCWGDDSRGETGVGYPIPLSARPDSAMAVVGGQTYLVIRGGPESTCGLVTNGDLWCWGGSAVEGDGYAPRAVQVGYRFKTLAYGGNIGGRGLVCATDEADALYCFGYEAHALLPQPTPAVVQLPQGESAAQVSVGGTWLPFLSLPYGYDLHVCSVVTAAAALCWGSNDYGQLGNGTTDDNQSPTAVPNVSNVAYVTAGGIHTCALTNDGMAYCWGGNARGQLGIGEEGPGQTTPQAVLPEQ